MYIPIMTVAFLGLCDFKHELKDQTAPIDQTKPTNYVFLKLLSKVMRYRVILEGFYFRQKDNFKKVMFELEILRKTYLFMGGKERNGGKILLFSPLM